MNVIKLCGGLGNQIFQYAFGKAQMVNGMDVLYDRGWFYTKSAQGPLRRYLLDKFNVNVKFGFRTDKIKLISERGFDLELLQKDGCYFSGYWQYPAYYEKILPVLRKEICVKKELYTGEFLDLRQEIIMNDNSVSVHVRREDYMYLDGFPVMSMEYYQRALRMVQGDVYVFSDDMQWCRDNFKGVKFIHLNEYFDFELMRLCHHNILSRSSFGWWAAYLNSNLDKIVVVPNQQLKCKIRKRAEKYESSEFDPKEWIKC